MFSIGFRRLGSPWQKDLNAVCRFAKENGFEFLDIGPELPEVVKEILARGLGVGTVDLLRPWDALASPDTGKRNEAADRAAEHVKACVAAGARTFFCVAFPEDATRKRSENLALAAEGYGRLCQAIAGTGAKIAIEGYPGSPPYFSALACTPEGYRALFAAVGSDAMGVNFDPSHLIRMGIDPVRFFREFAHRIWHVHAKDTKIPDEDLYQFGNLQPATLVQPHRWGGHHWRYTIPGNGAAPWPTLLGMMKGLMSIELEDEEFNGTEEGEKRGLLASRDFLRDSSKSLDVADP
jgi:sugar phosphate isomerase/epimerase